MSRILISAASSILVDSEFRLAVFYDGVINALIKSGNDVRAINSSNFLNRVCNSVNDTSILINKSKLIEDIKKFDPELIIAFNNSIPRIILDKTNCKIAVWDADSIHFYNDKEYIKNNMDRYIFLCFSNAGIKNALKFGAKESQTHLLLAGTAVYAEPLAQDKNISFIGTRFSAPDEFLKLLKDHGAATVKPVLDDLALNYYTDQKAILRKHRAEWFEDYVDAHVLASLSSAQNRTALLNDLQELGLTIYGTSDWYDTGTLLPWLAMSYDSRQVYSLQHNQDIYNSSKICINISHAQATDGFPWRVMDIMASNGCLVSDKKSGLQEFTEGYVDIPMYETRQEAVDLCQRLLKDDIWRRDIVAGAQKCIEDKGRWGPRFQELSEITGIELYNPKAASDDSETELSFERSILGPKAYEAFYVPFLKATIRTIIKFLPKPFVRTLYSMLISLNIQPPYIFVAYAKNLSPSKKRVN